MIDLFETGHKHFLWDNLKKIMEPFTMKLSADAGCSMIRIYLFLVLRNNQCQEVLAGFVAKLSE
jgi:hypothetical protein